MPAQATVSARISSFPRPEVRWHLNNNLLLLPDQTSPDGKFHAELVKTLGDNIYLVMLNIREVSKVEILCTEQSLQSFLMSRLMLNWTTFWK